MTSIAEYERWAFGEGWAAGLREGRRRGFEEGYGAGFDAGAEIAGRERTAPTDEPCLYSCRSCSRCVRAAGRSVQSGRPR
jgi:hypothetical protein